MSELELNIDWKYGCASRDDWPTICLDSFLKKFNVPRSAKKLFVIPVAKETKYSIHVIRILNGCAVFGPGSPTPLYIELSDWLHDQFKSGFHHFEVEYE